MKKISPISLAGFSGLALTLVYLFYYLKKVDISLTYFWQQSIPLSFGESLKIPGGISGLLADLIMEFFTQPFWGSLMVALLLLLVFISLKLIFRKVENNPLLYALLIAALIPFLLLFPHCRFPFELLVSITLGLLITMLHSYYSPRNLAAKSLFNFIAATLVYIVAGVPGLLVLLQGIIIQVIYSKRYVELVSVLPLLILPLLYLPFNLSISIKQAFLGQFLISPYDEIPLALYFSLSVPLLLFLVFSVLNFVFLKFTLKRHLLISACGIIIVILAMAYATNESFNESEKNAYSITQASFDKEWDRVLQLTEKSAFINNLVQFEVNRALYGTGQLLDKMFYYPQQFAEKGIFLDAVISSQVAIHTAAFYYDLGFANEARHWATEAQMVLVRHPIVLKQLVMSYIAIGQEKTAEKYLLVLSGSRLYKEWCDHVYSMLENNQADEDPDIRFFRINNPSVDFFAGTKDPLRKLKMFYSSNRSNNIAFEFLVAGYLLEHNVGAVVALLPQFKQQGHERFPKAVEEALMIYLSRSGSNPSVLSNYAISKNTVEEFKDFSSLIANLDSRAERMKKVSKYKNTYWYYILFSSPYATKK